MAHYEFKVVPAPDRVQPMVESPRRRDSFCETLQVLLNDLGAEGWDFVRVESLPLRHGFWSFRAPVEERCLMIFRRECAEAETETAKKAPTKSAPAPTQPQMASRKEVPHFVRTARLAETPTLKAVGKGTGSG